uniref:p2C01 n=1 Tax=Arundo donax TaxID=35708 RepID=A0A0A9AF81_ARUDO
MAASTASPSRPLASTPISRLLMLRFAARAAPLFASSGQKLCYLLVLI